MQAALAENTGSDRVYRYALVSVMAVVPLALVGFAGGPTPEDSEDQI
ncbi:MAG: hypothetical protein M3309_00400 [Actinomycetota bacterium]|nr:hypothetical protein [Actinomycetota bacterium]